MGLDRGVEQDTIINEEMNEHKRRNVRTDGRLPQLDNDMAIAVPPRAYGSDNFRFIIIAISCPFVKDGTAHVRACLITGCNGTS